MTSHYNNHTARAKVIHMAARMAVAVLHYCLSVCALNTTELRADFDSVTDSFVPVCGISELHSNAIELRGYRASLTGELYAEDIDPHRTGYGIAHGREGSCGLHPAIVRF